MNTFSFDFEAFNYWPIYETIKKYYPIGIPFSQESYKFYSNYSGSKELSDIVLGNIRNDDYYQVEWKTFEEYLKNKFNKVVIGTTYGQAPSFSSYLIIEQEEHKGIVYSKELHFSISLLGPYYSIYGMDKTTILLKQESLPGELEESPGLYEAINAITISPFLEYEEHFLQLEKIINGKHPDYRLIPYDIHNQIIKGLQLPHRQKETCTIFNAIFHDNHEFDYMLIRGDDYYGYDGWSI